MADSLDPDEAYKTSQGEPTKVHCCSHEDGEHLQAFLSLEGVPDRTH